MRVKSLGYVCPPFHGLVANIHRIRYALQFIASRTQTANASHKKTNLVGPFIEHHILGIVARLSEVVNDSRDEQSVTEKERCVKAVGEMVKVGKTHTRIARPQVRYPYFVCQKWK